VATSVEIIDRVRREIGDRSEPFRQTYRGTGEQDEFDLPVQRIATGGLNAYTTDPDSLVSATLVLNTDYTLDSENGLVRLTTILPPDVLLVVEGLAFGMFTDDELEMFVAEALSLHLGGDSYETARYLDGRGFIQYDRVKKTLETLPEIEELPLAILASIQALWALSVDASTDIDVVTSEGTHIPRGQRFGQLQTQIAAQESRYEHLCSLLGVGLYRISVSNLRRVSRMTNRLVPLFVEREYDQVGLPTRILPEIDAADADVDGPPSPAQNLGGL